MLVEKLTDGETALLEVLKHPVWFGEFIERVQEADDEPDPFTWSNYQEEMLCDFSHFVSFCTARSVGKTTVIISKMIWTCFNGWFDEILFVVPNRVHLDPVFSRVRLKIQNHQLLSWWVDRHSFDQSRYVVKFLNSVILTCRIAGTAGDGTNVIGLHLDCIFLDEGGYFPYGTWLELQPVLNAWVPGYQLLVAGVPTGLREKNVLYQCDMEDVSFKKHRISSHENPRWDDMQEKRALVQYGGADSEDYKHFVLGEHGSPVFALFDRNSMTLQAYDFYMKKLYGTYARQSPTYIFENVLAMPKFPSVANCFRIGVDLGYTEPTAIVGVYRANDKWYQLFRLELYQVEYDKQRMLFDLLDTKYNPEFISMDIGAGGSGKSVYHEMINNKEYEKKNYYRRLIPVDFNGNILVGKDDKGEDLKVRAKHFAIQQLQQKLNLGMIILPKKDEDFISELERTTYVRTPTGNIIYKTLTPAGGEKGGDHNLSAYLTIMIAEYLSEGNFFEPPKRLHKIVWVK
jgi:hypothetical protein